MSIVWHASDTKHSSGSWFYGHLHETGCQSDTYFQIWFHLVYKWSASKSETTELDCLTTIPVIYWQHTLHRTRPKPMAVRVGLLEDTELLQKISFQVLQFYPANHQYISTPYLSITNLLGLAH